MLSFKNKIVGRANYTMKDYMMDLLWSSLTRSERVELIGDNWEADSDSIPNDVFLFWTNNFNLVRDFYQKFIEN
jgi:hypothetical protein